MLTVIQLAIEPQHCVHKYLHFRANWAGGRAFDQAVYLQSIRLGGNDAAWNLFLRYRSNSECLDWRLC